MNGNQLKACPRCGGRAEKEFFVRTGKCEPFALKEDRSFAFDGKVKCTECGFSVGVCSDYEIKRSENPGVQFVDAENYIVKVWQSIEREDAE